METRQLEYLVAVAEELNFTRAAERVFAAQSTVSAGVRALERELGAALFERDPHGVRPTATGVAVLEEAREALRAVERVRDAARGDGELRGVVRVGIFTNLTTIDLPGIMGEFHQRHPLVDLRLGPSPSGSTGLAEDVRQGRLDVAFVGLPDRLPGLLERELAVSPFVAVVAADHALAGRPEVSLAELADEQWVDARAGFGNRVTLDRELAARGISRRVPTELSDLGEIPRFVAARLGVAVLPALTVIPAAGAVVIPLRERIEWRLDAIARPRPSTAALAMLDLLSERFGRSRTLEAR
ncbi:LysR family transcriptional regulator [Leifsonia sp. LS1]|uniref:LysR family transcriptional regulator n=1 Tax=Leifsonia sp. LS1 TaxID=2828483 RepID=UPI001CFC7449|nr:LysR family transcriptional regulator [Leifsonia sp. LS1]GIT80022.1 LysR family transcriptional regulator [Leifsonia sp. LS1]